MLLLIPRALPCRRPLHIHLHSTMLLLIPELKHGSFLYLHIYIPLCFYLYSERIRQNTWRENNLHSTMLLLILISAKYRGLSSFRFTFHYASTYTQTEMRIIRLSRNLHSTMLLLIRSCRLGCTCRRLFTFHYASTYTRPAILYFRFHFYLHSTMLLLILFAYLSIFSLSTQFTFHYASTYTLLFGFPCRGRCDLHSTMLLLIRLIEVLVRSLFRIYIPLCFYLYVFSFRQSLTPSDLHSTMLLLIPVHFSLLIYIISYFLNCRPPFFAFPLSFFSSSIF